MPDFGPEYMAHRANLAQSTAADELLSRVQGGAAGEGKPVAPATAPPAAMTPASEGSVAGRIAKDVGTGVIETPRAIVKGVRDAYQNAINMGRELGGWLEENNIGGGIVWDTTSGHLTLRLAGGKELADLERNPDFFRPAEHMNLPDLNAPKSVTGGFIKGAAQFITAMRGAGKTLEAAGVPQAAGTLGYSRSALQGFLANFGGFDPHQQRLSNLIEKFPQLQNPVTAFLAADPSDNAAEGRFKNALEGLGLGILTDGFFKAVRTLKGVVTVKASAQAAAEGAPGELADDAFRLLGDESTTNGAKLVRTRKVETPSEAPLPGGTPPNIDPSKLGKGTAEPETFINFARIDTADDVKRAMQELADASKPAIDAARRGTQTFEQIKLNAQQRDAWKDILARRAGEPLSAEASLGARQLWVSSTNKLTELAQSAAESPSEANLFAFRKMLATHDVIQQQVLAARTETARALAQWRIPAGGSAERLRDVTEALQAAGGGDIAHELATRVAALGRAGMVKEMGEVAEKTAYATTRDALLEGWINGLLSNPKTHVVNMTSNSTVLPLRIAERKAAEKIGSLLGTEQGIAAGEAAQQYQGLVDAIPDAFRYAAKSARTGESGFGLGKVEMPREGSITSEAFKISSESWLGRGVDFLGSLVRTPGRALGAEDEFFKTIGYRMELRAQSWRQAMRELPEATDDAIAARAGEILTNPPENLRMAAVDAATYQTFTNAPGKLAQSLSKLTNHYPALKVILPFVKTPANILRFTFERTPLAPIMSQFRQAVAAGGARRDLALAQMGVGTMAMLATADLAMKGRITGSGPVERGTRDALQRQGWQPYSLKVGDRWYNYNRLDPIGSLLGMSADVVDAMRNMQHEAVDDADTESLAVAAALALGGNLVNKTYLSGVANLFEALSDPQRYGESKIQGLVGSVVPGAVAAAARVEDPYQRQVYSTLDAMKARIPGLSETLPPKRNLWGEPASYASGFGKAFDALSPVASRAPDASPIDKELIRLDSNVTMPGKKTSFKGVTVDLGQYPEAYSRYLELSGNALKHPAWGLGAKDLLDKVVSGQHPLSAVYRLRSDGPDGGKDVFIQDTIRKYRELARDQLLKEYPKLAAEVREKQAQQRLLKMPVTQ